MSIGTFARKLLGNKLFPVAGRWYRSIFVDLQKVVDCFPEIEPGAHILDVGGGDGEIINILLNKYIDIRVTMIDKAPRIGGSLKPQYKDHVILLPNTSAKEYSLLQNVSIDYIIISDVIHHIPKSERSNFFSELESLIGKKKIKLIIKDVQPGYFRSCLGYLSDRYISSDKNTSLISKEALISYVLNFFPHLRYEETPLFHMDKPNYCIIFS